MMNIWMNVVIEMRTKQDFERLRHVDIMEDCWRIMFGYSETKEKEPLGKRAMEEMLYGIVHFGEAELGRLCVSLSNIGNDLENSDASGKMLGNYFSDRCMLEEISERMLLLDEYLCNVDGKMG
jgi:hypothetical protein